MLSGVADLKPSRLNFTVSFSVFVAAGLACFACSEDPSVLNSLSTKFTDTDIIIVADTLEAVTATSFRKYLPMNGPVNLAGTNGGHEAIMALQFTPGQFPQRDTIRVISAELRLRAVTWYGNPSGTLSLTAYKILKSWSSFTLTWDSLDVQLNPGFYEEGIVRGTYTGMVATDTESIVISLDTAMVREWLQPSTFTQYGIALVPATGSTFVRGFTPFGVDSIQFQPTLTVIAQNFAGTVQDTNEYALGSDTFAGNVDSLVTATDRMFVQAGVVYRTKITFDASSIPQGAIVNKAELLLTRDVSASQINKFSADTLVAVHVLTTGTEDGTFELQGSLATQRSDSSIAFEIRHAVQIWVNGTNNGILLRANTLSEFSTFDLHVFYGPTASDTAVRPRVQVLYSIEKGTAP